MEECNCGHEHACEECGKEPCECEEMDTEDIVEQNDLILNALIELLIEKGIISEDEFNKKVEDLEDLWYESEEGEE